MKKLKIAVIMDPIEKIHPHKDTTFALMLEAQKRHWEIFYLTYENLCLDHNNIICQATPLHVFDKDEHFYQFLAPPALYALRDFDITLMRKDPPFDARFLYATYLLDLAKREGCFIVNDPTAIRNANEKLFSAWFPHCCPETLVSAHADIILNFLATHSKIIIKPLDQRGGYGVLLLDQNDLNIYSCIELLTEGETLPIIAQRYLPEIITEGDKRLLIIDGEPYPYTLVRIPKTGDMRGNLRVGATAVGQPLTERDRWIAQQVGPTLKAQGLFFAGLDLIGGYLTEINITSPTGVREIDKLFNVNVSEHIWNRLEKIILQLQ